MRLLILDRDGTLVSPQSGEEFPVNPFDFKPIPGVREKLESMASMGYYCTVASNQGGANDMKSVRATIDEMMYLGNLFPDLKHAIFAPKAADDEDGFGVMVNYYGHPQYSIKVGHGNYRKPGTGMLQALIEEFRMHYGYGVDGEPIEVLFVGNEKTDAEAAANLDVKYMDVQAWLADPVLVVEG